eukprot:3619715-Rhodomonas_salina.1
MGQHTRASGRMERWRGGGPTPGPAEPSELGPCLGFTLPRHSVTVSHVSRRQGRVQAVDTHCRAVAVRAERTHMQSRTLEVCTEARPHDRYVGQFKAGVPHGEGELVFTDGTLYKGVLSSLSISVSISRSSSVVLLFLPRSPPSFTVSPQRPPSSLFTRLFFSFLVVSQSLPLPLLDRSSLLLFLAAANVILLADYPRVQFRPGLEGAKGSRFEGGFEVLCCYEFATRYRLLTQHMLLRACYALSGTEIGYAATRRLLRTAEAFSVTPILLL